MSDIIESNPEILGGKPIIKGTRIPVALIYELIGLNYSIADIIKEYPHLDSKVILTLLEIGKDANQNLLNVDIDDIISKEVHQLIFLLDENVPISIKEVIHELGFEVFTLHDFNKLGIQNGEVAKLALKEKAIIITLDSDFLQLNKSLQKKSRVIYIKINPRDPKKIKQLLYNGLKKYVSKLNTPCKLIITEDNIILDEIR